MRARDVVGDRAPMSRVLALAPFAPAAAEMRNREIAQHRAGEVRLEESARPAHARGVLAAHDVPEMRGSTRPQRAVTTLTSRSTAAGTATSAATAQAV